MKKIAIAGLIFASANIYAETPNNIIRFTAPVSKANAITPPGDQGGGGQAPDLNIDQSNLPSGMRTLPYSIDLNTRLSGELPASYRWQQVQVPSGISISDAGILSGYPSAYGNTTVIAYFQYDQTQVLASFPLSIEKFKECKDYNHAVNGWVDYGAPANSTGTLEDPNNGTRISWNSALLYSTLDQTKKSSVSSITIGAYRYSPFGVAKTRATTFNGYSYKAYDRGMCREDI